MSFRNTLMIGAALVMGLSGAAYANGFKTSFSLGGATGHAVTSSGGGSSSTSGSASIGGGIAGGATAGFSTTTGGAMASGNRNGVEVQDYRNSASGGLNFSGSLGSAGTLNASEAGAGGHEAASGSFANFSGKISGLPPL
ncbi:MAG: hypothetical protein ACREFO_06170 [Acetobacteraceae bacterium]